MTGGVKQVTVVARPAPRNGQGSEPTAFFDESGAPIEFGGGEAGPVSFGDLTDVPAALTAAQAAGTASIRAIGTTATTAAAGNHTQAATTVTVAAGTGIVGANVQLVLADLAARVVALEAETP